MIGVYSGAEDNVFWRRLPTDRGGMRSIEAAGAQSMRAGDVAVLEADIVHSVINPISRFTCSLQIYGGNFYAIERSEWDPDSLREQPYDLNAARRKFEDANAALGRNETSGGD